MLEQSETQSATERTALTRGLCVENSPGVTLRQAGPPEPWELPQPRDGAGRRLTVRTRTAPGATRQALQDRTHHQAVTSCCSHSRKKKLKHETCHKNKHMGAASVLSGAGWVFSLGPQAGRKGLLSTRLAQPGKAWVPSTCPLPRPLESDTQDVCFRQAC